MYRDFALLILLLSESYRRPSKMNDDLIGSIVKAVQHFVRSVQPTSSNGTCRAAVISAMRELTRLIHDLVNCEFIPDLDGFYNAMLATALALQSLPNNLVGASTRTNKRRGCGVPAADRAASLHAGAELARAMSQGTKSISFKDAVLAIEAIASDNRIGASEWKLLMQAASKVADRAAQDGVGLEEVPRCCLERARRTFALAAAPAPAADTAGEWGASAILMMHLDSPGADAGASVRMATAIVDRTSPAFASIPLGDMAVMIMSVLTMLMEHVRRPSTLFLL